MTFSNVGRCGHRCPTIPGRWYTCELAHGHTGMHQEGQTTWTIGEDRHELPVRCDVSVSDLERIIADAIALSRRLGLIQDSSVARNVHSALEREGFRIVPAAREVSGER